jgi:hypothetical protein
MKRIGGPGDDRATALTLDNDNRVIVTGSFSDTVDFSGDKLNPATVHGPAGFLATYASDGSFIWVNAFGPKFQHVGRKT